MKFGKYGCYFHDQIQNADLTLSDIERVLNNYIKAVEEINV